MDPVTLAVLMGLTTAVTNPEVAGGMAKGLNSVFDKDAKAYRKSMKQMRERLNKNDFGLTEIEKNQAMSGVARQQQAAAKGTMEEIRQQGAAMGGRTAASAEALRGVASDLAGQAAGTRGALEAESAKLANIQRDAARQMIDARRKEKAAAAEAAGRTIAEGAGSFEEGFKNSMMGAKSPSNAEGPAGAMGVTGKSSGQAMNGSFTTGAAEAKAEKERLEREHREKMMALSGGEWSNTYTP